MDLKGLKFSKMHGIGNDFPIIDESAGEVIPEADKAEACRFLCHRHFGVGGDGVLFVTPSDVADIGYKVPVHHVKVHQVDTGLQQAGAVMLQVGKIGRQDRCGNFRHNVYTPLIVPLCCT